MDAARRRLDQALAAIAAKEAAEARAREAEQKLMEAEAHLENGDLAGAADKLKQAGALAPHDPRVDELAARLREATERRAAAEAAERRAKEIADLIAGASERFQAAGDQDERIDRSRCETSIRP